MAYITQRQGGFFEYSLAVLLVLFLGTVGSGAMAIRAKNAQIEKLQLQVANCNLNKADLQKSFDYQNQTIKKYEIDLEQLEYDKQQLQDSLTEKRKVLVKTVMKIVRQPIPKTCKASIQHLKDSVSDFKEW